MQGDCDGSRGAEPSTRRQRKSLALQEKQGVHELEPKSDDGEVFGLCETTTQIHFGGLSPPQCERFHQFNLRKSHLSKFFICAAHFSTLIE